MLENGKEAVMVWNRVKHCSYRIGTSDAESTAVVKVNDVFEKYGKEEASKRIYATTDKVKGALNKKQSNIPFALGAKSIHT